MENNSILFGNFYDVNHQPNNDYDDDGHHDNDEVLESYVCFIFDLVKGVYWLANGALYLFLFFFVV